MAIKLEHICYTYGSGTTEEKMALKDINLEIGDHECIAIAGHTGSGKSTLLQLLNGLEKPTAGTVYYNGQDISAGGFPVKKLRGDVGLVFQYPEHQLFEATVLQDVMFGPKNLGWDLLEVELNAFQALKDVGIDEELLDVSPLALSGGQKRRVALAGVLAMKPKVLVLDEPMAGLDPAGRRDIFRLLMRIYEERGLTIIFVSHSMEDVAEYATRVIIMEEGQVVLDGSPRKIFAFEKELRQIGLDVPQSVGLLHHLKFRGIELPEGAVTVEETVEVLAAWLQSKGKRGTVQNGSDASASWREKGKRGGI